ncbi:MAG: Shikimate kinase I (EC [uncultured Thiotrichaceae bacterium]|uniref:Shikimate kinase n=1 Tax=uncultured Thiotrichaceae bacterium TaxID=298394 RepID=A0A6S6UC37_9GAMM|nr:MAG: Shikimate kinase I (EC [uncultured Thiotrichaceae bacterium]
MGNIILVGLMGAGKSTVGRIVGRKLKMDFFDSDHMIVERTGVDIPTIFEIEGEAGFREREEAMIQELCEKDNIIIATGGGSLMRQTNREHIKKSGKVVYLRTSAEQLFSRIRHDKSRPLMQTKNPLRTLKDLLRTREKDYMETADLVVNTGRQRINITAQQIIVGIEQMEHNIQ